MIPWWFGSLVANLCICRIEALNRVGGFEDFGDAIQSTWWLILLSQWGLFNAWNGAPSFMLAWATFSSMNMVFRLISVNLFVGETMNLATWLGVTLTFGGVMVIKFWGTPG